MTDAEKVHKVANGYLLVDGTFAPPPLMNPFKWGCDIVFHSGTKYFGYFIFPVFVALF